MNVNIAAVQQRQGAPGGQLRDRPQRRWSAVRRPEAGASPVCQVLPPGFPGHESTTARTPRTRARKWSAPDMDKAKAAGQGVRHARPEGRRSSSQDDEVNKAIGDYLQSVLNEIGYKAHASRRSPATSSSPTSRTPTTRCRSACTQWYQDYPAASDFLNVLLGCESFHPGSDTAINIAGFCDKTIDRRRWRRRWPSASPIRTRRQQAVGEDRQGDHRQGAGRRRCSRRKHIDFVSKRVGNFQFSAQFYYARRPGLGAVGTGPARLRAAAGRRGAPATCGELPASSAAARGRWPGRRLRRNRAAMAALAGFCVIVVLRASRAGCTPHDVAHTDPFQSNLDGTTIVDGKEVPVMQQSTGGPRARRDADRADLGLPPLLPRRRRPGPRRRGAAALRRAQLAADRRRVGR